MRQREARLQQEVDACSFTPKISRRGRGRSESASRLRERSPSAARGAEAVAQRSAAFERDRLDKLRCKREAKEASSAALVAEVFRWARSVAPSQPLSVGVWEYDDEHRTVPGPLNEVALANSDTWAGAPHAHASRVAFACACPRVYSLRGRRLPSGQARGQPRHLPGALHRHGLHHRLPRRARD